MAWIRSGLDVRWLYITQAIEDVALKPLMHCEHLLTQQIPEDDITPYIKLKAVLFGFVKDHANGPLPPRDRPNCTDQKVLKLYYQ